VNQNTPVHWISNEVDMSAPFRCVTSVHKRTGKRLRLHYYSMCHHVVLRIHVNISEETAAPVCRWKQERLGIEAAGSYETLLPILLNYLLTP